MVILDQVVGQAEFGAVVGISQQRVSQLLADGVIPAGPLGAQILAYASWLREQAAGRTSPGGGLDLVQERAALAREQREGYALKNAVARGEYAPIGLLADVLAQASAAVVDRFDALPGVLRKVCPELPAPARDAIAAVLTSARNEWVRATAELVVAEIDNMVEDDDDDLVGDMTDGADLAR